MLPLRPLRNAALVATMLACPLFSACTRSDQITYTCTTDSQCTSGRCIAGACVDPGTTPDIDPIDGRGDDTAAVDARVDTDAVLDAALPEPGTLGDACSGDQDCIGGVCVPFADGSLGYCSEPCVAECPDDDYVCDALADGRFACVFVGSPECGIQGVCRPGGTMRETGPCGSCGEGTRDRSRICGADCRWGAWDLSQPCLSDAECSAGAVDREVEACVGCNGEHRERTRICDSSSCAWGEWGDWGPCIASGAADAGGSLCTPGAIETETRSCGACGLGSESRTRACEADGCTLTEWSEWSGCTLPEATCEPGVTESETEACGACGGGTRARQRSCLASCTFAPWSDWGECSVGPAECSPGETQTESRGCGNCNRGNQTRSRGCDAATCTWGGWSDWTGCSGGGECSPGATRECERCGVNVCNASCSWDSACVPRAGAECLWNSGRNWRCCGSGRWQFCLPDTCRWSGDCAPCSGCGC